MAKRSSRRDEPARLRINHQIRVTPVRVIGEDGKQLGIMPTREALRLADEAGLDLVEVAPDADPPVCRIMDYGKYQYEQKKRLHKAHAHRTKVKEIRLRPGTAPHDIEVKVNRAREFLAHKDKVHFTVQFRGREKAHMEEGHRVLQRVIESLEDVAKIEMPPKQNGARLECRLAPK